MAIHPSNCSGHKPRHLPVSFCEALHIQTMINPTGSRYLSNTNDRPERFLPPQWPWIARAPCLAPCNLVLTGLTAPSLFTSSLFSTRKSEWSFRYSRWSHHSLSQNPLQFPIAFWKVQLYHELKESANSQIYQGLSQTKAFTLAKVHSLIQSHILVTHIFQATIQLWPL